MARPDAAVPQDGLPSLDVAAHYLPSGAGALIGGDWYDAMQLPDGAALLTVGDLTGHGVAATTGMAMLLGALRGLALAGIEPGPLMARLNELLDRAAQPALGSALCCRYEPRRAHADLVAGRAPRPGAVPRRDRARPAGAGGRAARCDADRRVRPAHRAVALR